MSGIFCAYLKPDAGTIGDIGKLAQRSKKRGHDALGWVYLTNAGIARQGTVELKLPRPEEISTYRVIGTWNAAPPSGLKGTEISPYNHGPWTIAIDGAISNATPLEVAQALTHSKWKDVVTRLTGQFAIIGMNVGRPFIYFAVKAKPLYGLVDSINRGVMVASDPDCFHGMHHATRNARPFALGPYGYGEIDGIGGSLNEEAWPEGTYQGSLVLCGGGLDSLVAARDIQQTYPSEDMILMYVDYGAKAAAREKSATRSIAEYLNDLGKNGAITRMLDVGTDFFRRYTQSSLTTTERGIATRPTRGQATEWVPARNTVLMSLALSLAETNGIARIACGINQDAASAYPDNDTEWLRRWRELSAFTLNDRTIHLEAPLETLTKTEIVKLGNQLRIPWAKVESWSCYNGGEMHCGACSSCIARRGAFRQARVTDPTSYRVEVDSKHA